MSGKGFAFKGSKLKPKQAPEELRDLPTPQDEALSAKPTSVTTAKIGFLQKKEAVIAAKPPPKLKGVAAKATEPVVPPAVEEVPADTVARKKFQFKRPLAPIPVPESKEAEEETKEAEDEDDFEEPEFTGDLDEMASLIREEETNDPYEGAPPPAYVPESRRGFSEFVKETYDSFMLDAAAAANPTPTGEKYPYQKFVREYMRQASPYRGLLVYHGLGSGKTCTAIATSEALYSTANKKIIVMTPFSLQKNFLKEVSLCGFRHYRLQNYWVELSKAASATSLFATTVLGLSADYVKRARAIWVPDFRKGAEEANYSSLSADQQGEIRKQILSVLVWHPVNNPTGRLRFISYNGISARKLQEMACKKPYADFFDDAVIIIDEVHNMVRLMQGDIDPYVVKLKGMRRLIPYEEIKPDPWAPALCQKVETVDKRGVAKEDFKKKYSRGYLFYRLLLQAKNSKIIGLSGTPLINFPEELGILMNVLHGYIPVIEGTIQQVGTEAQTTIKSIATAHPFVDFVRVGQDAQGGGTRLTVTLLPYGVRKIENDVGVERLGPDETVPSADDIVKDLTAKLEEAKMVIGGGGLSVKSVPLLPPTDEEFRQKFVAADGVTLQNKIVLVKRLTGLISYYKGSRADLMPRVKVDEVVRVPMSSYSQRTYVEARKEEITKELKPKSQSEGLAGIWAEVYEVGKGSKSSNYKMASRQGCNFAFPPEVVRPRPKSKKDEMLEADAGNTGTRDIIDTAPDSEEPRDAEGFPEAEAADAALEEEAEEAAADDDEFAAGAEGAEETAAQTGGGDEVDGKEMEEAKEQEESKEAEEPTTTRKKFILKGLMEKKAAALKSDCKTGQKPGEPYKDAIVRAKECLRTIARDRLIAGGENGLETYSPKFAEMLKRIAAAPGSSLVYSQFLDMEGIGIFRIAMDANGYAPIEILKTPTGPAFSKQTEESLRKGPGSQNRYITFSGGEEEDIRRLALDIFNAKLDELPANLKAVLEESGYQNNHRGEICRVFCITSAGAEGLSLKCVRAVHIMEPYWNDVRLKQVKGRAIRIGSHLELPESDRDVSIYTYITSYSAEAQGLKAGDDRIDETIRLKDSVDRKDALTLGLPIPLTAMTYVMTTDERLYVIAERKKAIINALESVMKSCAVDCELNIQENKDGTFKCLPLKGKVGDFLYHPDIDIDIRESASMYSVAEKAPAAAAAVPAPTLPAGVTKKKFRDKIYLMKELKDESSGQITGFEMYAEDDMQMKRLLATAGAKDGRPGPPVKFL